MEIELQQLICSYPNPIYYKDQGGKYIACSTSYAKLLGLMPEDVINKTDIDLHQNDHDLFGLANDKKSIVSGVSFSSLKIPYQTKERFYDVVNLSYREGKLFGRMASECSNLINMTKKYEQVESNHKLLLDIIACMPGNVYWLDAKGHFQGCNENVAKMLGLECCDNIIGLTHEDVAKRCHWSDGQAESFKRDDMEVIAKGSPKEHVEEPPITSIDGEELYFLTSRVPLFDKHKKRALGIVGISVNITELKHTQQALIVAKEDAEVASNSKATFLANMSHDLKTPLFGIVYSAAYLLEKVEEGDQREFVQIIQSSAQRLLENISNILVFIKYQSGKLPLNEVDISLKAVIDEALKTIQPLITNKDISLSANVSPLLPENVYGDRQRLERILQNLLGNAIKFTERGSIKLLVEEVQKNSDVVLVSFIISDTGIGISKERQQGIFDQFSRVAPSHSSKYEGSGLGLSIVKQFTQEMGGDIVVESTGGKGSTFTFCIPFKLKAVEQHRNKED